MAWQAQEDDWPGAQAAVPSHEPVLAENTFQPGESRNQEEHDEEQVASREARDLACGRRDPARRCERPPCHRRQSESQGDAEPDSGHHRDHVGRPLRPPGVALGAGAVTLGRASGERTRPAAGTLAVFDMTGTAQALTGSLGRV